MGGRLCGSSKYARVKDGKNAPSAEVAEPPRDPAELKAQGRDVMLESEELKRERSYHEPALSRTMKFYLLLVPIFLLLLGGIIWYARHCGCYVDPETRAAGETEHKEAEQGHERLLFT
mmetsp:Transcript_99474/g.197120  ORF Transcript_99474/g.197120 Transcript_99474/m.197120 type:complete len:118 (+) Transcript_99474:88-441(+)